MNKGEHGCTDGVKFGKISSGREKRKAGELIRLNNMNTTSLLLFETKKIKELNERVPISKNFILVSGKILL